MAEPTSFNACPKCGEENITGVLVVYGDWCEIEQRGDHYMIQDWEQDGGIVDSTRYESIARCSDPDCDWQVRVYAP